MEQKKWFCKVNLIIISLIGIWSIIIIIVDPYFHFHKPIEGISYRLYHERYINDGISRNFEYDAFITGSSMTQNFKTSEIDELFGVNSVKMSFSGTTYEEVYDNVSRTLDRSDNIKKVFWGFDLHNILSKDGWGRKPEYPTYLYDDNLINDFSYILNKEVMYGGVLRHLVDTICGKESVTFDEYSAFDRPLGAKYVMEDEEIIKISDREVQIDITEAQLDYATHSIENYVIPAIENHPEVEFNIFLPNYSIAFWNDESKGGRINARLDAMTILARSLLEYDNVKLYSFYDQYEIITNLDNYSDTMHYSSEINSMILTWMSEDVGLLTKGNYMQKIEEIREFYLNYNYDEIDAFIP